MGVGALGGWEGWGQGEGGGVRGDGGDGVMGWEMVMEVRTTGPCIYCIDSTLTIHWLNI